MLTYLLYQHLHDDRPITRALSYPEDKSVKWVSLERL